MRILYLIPFLFIACSQVTEPIQINTGLSGQYQDVPYNDHEGEPSIILLLSQRDNELAGTGTFNGICFSFTGTVINNHIMIYFVLNDTNIGDLNCSFDLYSLCGGYSLRNANYNISEKIRFRKVIL